MPEEIFSVFLTITYGLILVSIVVLVNSFERIIMDILWPLDMQFYSTKWNRVQELSSVEISSPLAIIYANSLLDDALKKREYPDETMCQRLESARSVFRNKKQVWNANQIAHGKWHYQLFEFFVFWINEISDMIRFLIVFYQVIH
jgi:hypothetical protein